jgi:hypothetical protein
MSKQRARNPVWDMLKGMVRHGFENVGVYYSLYRAFVGDNDDPENLQRLKLIIPQISGTELYEYWAFPRNVFYGQGYGSQVVPQRGDVVWVEFEGGKPEIPIWSHGHPARKEMPEDEDLKDKNCYWFVSPSGHKVKINDTKKSIHIETADGDFIEWNQSAISIVPTKTKKISLGKLNGSTYHAVQGEDLRDLLADINTILKKLHGAMVSDLAAFTDAHMIHMVTAIPEVEEEVSTLTEKLGKILSDVVTLE